MKYKTRKQKITSRIANAGCRLGFGGTSYAAYCDPAWVEINQIKIPMQTLSNGLDGFRIVQLSDLHHSRLVSRSYIRYCVELANRLKPDLFLLTGDYVTNSARFAEPVAEELAKLKSSFGTYAVLGNHDYWANGILVRKALHRFGIHVLINDHVKFTFGKNRHLWLLGVDDLWAGDFNLDKTVSNTATHEPRILLMHNPDTFHEAAQHEIDLVLCGHTHGGQVSIPRLGPIIVPSRYGKRFAAGLFQHGKTRMYVNKGLGMISPPVRFGVRPEITEFTLYSDKPN